jgi:hypothetical protein
MLEMLIADELKKIVQAANEKNPRPLMFSSLREIETDPNTTFHAVRRLRGQTGARAANPSSDFRVAD